MNSGVYRISCISNGHFYYGSSINISSRFKNHISKLRSGKHRNKRLQRIFNKYGEDSLVFEVIQYCEEDFILDNEQEFLNEHIENPNCVNFCKSAKAPMAGIKFSEKHKNRISESQQRNEYIFKFSCGKVEKFKSLSQVGKRFGVRNSIVSRWFKKKNLGNSRGFLNRSNIISASKTGDENILLLPLEKKEEMWKLSGATSKTQYYRNKRKSGK